MSLLTWSPESRPVWARGRLREETDVGKTRFSEEQIIAVLREQEGGMKTADVCRKHGISSATPYAWKAKYGGMDGSQARKLKVLEEENARHKRLLADDKPDHAANGRATGRTPGTNAHLVCRHQSEKK